MSSYRPNGSRRAYDPLEELVFQRASGCEVWDQHGNRFVDLVCGYSAVNFGHAYQPLVAAATAQLNQLHFAPGGDSIARRQLEKMLCELFVNTRGPTNSLMGVTADRFSATSLSSNNVKVWLSTTGARAMEIAWKLVHQSRPGKILRFDLSFHGRSLATSYISDTPRSSIFCREDVEGNEQSVAGHELRHILRESLRESVDGTSLREIGGEGEVVDRTGFVEDHFSYRIPFPRCGTRCDASCESCRRGLAECEALIRSVGEKISAIFIEPAIGSRGYYFASPEYMRRLVEIVRRAGVLVVSDEIQMGLGRLGAMMVHHEDGWNADLVVLGKSLGGGIVPISAVIGDAKLLDGMPSGVESETFAGAPFACGIAQCALGLLESEQLPKRAVELGELFRARLRTIVAGRIGIDGRGLATVVDMEDGSGKGPERTWYTVCRLRDKGFLVHRTGPHRDRIAIMPPLNIASTVLMDAANEIGRCTES